MLVHATVRLLVGISFRTALSLIAKTEVETRFEQHHMTVIRLLTLNGGIG